MAYTLSSIYTTHTLPKYTYILPKKQINSNSIDNGLTQSLSPYLLKLLNSTQYSLTPPGIINASENQSSYTPSLARCYSQIQPIPDYKNYLQLPPKKEEDSTSLNLHKIKPHPIVPNKIFRTLWLYAPKALWQTIHPEKRVAIEYAMIFCSLLTRYRKLEEKDSIERPYTNIASSLLIEIFGSPARYSAVLKLLKRGTAQHGAIIEGDNKYYVGGKCKGYRFAERYSDVGLQKHKLKTAKALHIYRNYTYKRLSKVSENPIIKHLLQTYPTVTLPTAEQLKERATELIAVGYTTNKGKILKFRKKKGRNHYKKGKYSFVEDSIKLFELLCQDGFIIPMVGDEKSGGRVVDSFTLLPSWIRDMIKIATKPVKQHDYTALHPNIALHLYGSKEEKKRLSGDIHSYLSKKYGIGRKTIKIENLSFFNKHPEHMKKSFLWDLYRKEAPQMLQNIIYEKYEYSYKVTSIKLFEQEVLMMTDVIRKIEKLKRSRMSFDYHNTQCIYVYDALYTNDIDISNIMNEVAQQRGILTEV